MKYLTPIKSIRQKCLDCCCGSDLEVRLCQVPDCAIYPYRMGKDPKRKGRGGNIAQLVEARKKIGRYQGKTAKKGIRKS